VIKEKGGVRFVNSGGSGGKGLVATEAAGELTSSSPLTPSLSLSLSFRYLEHEKDGNSVAGLRLQKKKKT